MENVTKYWCRCRAWDLARKGEEFLKFVGPGLLVTVGFIDPGNWAANLAAGAEYGYTLLWMVTLSTLMLIVLQHNAAHLGIVTGKCMAEAITEYFPRRIGKAVLFTALGASAMTSMAEILGGAIALRMLFSIPLPVGAALTALAAAGLLLFNSYNKVEKWIIGFVSVIGMAFLYELWLVPRGWVPEAAVGWVMPQFPQGSMLVIMSVLGAVVMPHNLFLHSEIIQSRQWNLEGDTVIKRRLDYEFFDTLFAMLVGWAINSAMIILAAATFWQVGQSVTELEQAKDLLKPLLGEGASVIFAVALLFAGVASTVTSGMAGGIISAGMAAEPYNTKDRHSLFGILGSLGCGLLLIWLTSDPFKGLLYSQMALSVQLPITMIALVSLTSSPKVMGKYANGRGTKLLLYVLTGIVTALNVMLLASALS